MKLCKKGYGVRYAAAQEKVTLATDGSRKIRRYICLRAKPNVEKHYRETGGCRQGFTISISIWCVPGGVTHVSNPG